MTIKFADMAPLVVRVKRFMEEREGKITLYRAPDDMGGFADAFGFTARGRGRPEVIVGEDVAVELGHPSTASRPIVLVTFRPGLVEPGRISLVGPELDATTGGERRSYGQVVMVGLREGAAPDPFDLENVQFLTHRLPGFMVRSVPGRLWVRVSKRACAKGLRMETVGTALIAAYSGAFEAVNGVEVLLVTSSVKDVEALAPVATEAEILAGRHKKLALGTDGEVECIELDCETCEEKPVCDNLRDVVIKRRKARDD